MLVLTLPRQAPGGRALAALSNLASHSCQHDCGPTFASPNTEAALEGERKGGPGALVWARIDASLYSEPF